MRGFFRGRQFDLAEDAWAWQISIARAPASIYLGTTALDVSVGLCLALRRADSQQAMLCATEL